MTTELTTPSFAREMTDQELDSVHGGMRPVTVIYVYDSCGRLIAVIIIS